MKTHKLCIEGWRWQDLSRKVDRAAYNAGVRVSNGFTMYKWLKKTYYYTALGNEGHMKMFNEELKK